MKIFKPLRDNVIVQRLGEKKDLFIPSTVASTWIKVKILAVGPLVIEKIKVGDIVWAENMINKFDYTKEDIGVILSKYLHVGEEEIGPKES